MAPPPPAAARAVREEEPPKYTVDLPAEVLAVIDEIDETINVEAHLRWLETGEGSSGIE